MPATLTRVLLIDDDPDDALILRDHFSDLGRERYSLDLVTTPEAALEKLRDQGSQYDAILLDYRLGSITGLDLLAQLQSEGFEQPVIFLTGFEDPFVDEEASRRGAADYLVKSKISALLLDRSLRYAIAQSMQVRESRRRESNLRKLFDSTFEAIVVHEPQGRMLELNAEAERLLGLTQKAVEQGDISLASCLGVKDEQEICKHLEQADGFPFEIHGKRNGFRHRVFEVTTKSYWSAAKEARLTAIRDISEKHDMQKQLLHQERLATVGLFASSMAHEVGTPLGVIRGRAEYVSMMVQDRPEIRSNMELIVSQIDRVTKLIRSWLSLVRQENRQAPAPVSIAETLELVAPIVRHELEKNKIALVNRLRSDALWVVADSEGLQQLLLNLLVNAMHAIAERRAKEPGHIGEISMTTEAVDGAVQLVVADNGAGIKPSALSELFKPFFTTKDVGQGTGLGLAICYQFVTHWGGHIEAENNARDGASFRITFRAAR